MRLHHPEQEISLSDFHTETTGPVAPSGSSKMLRSSLLKSFSPSLSFSAFLPQFLRNLTHFTTVSGRSCDEGTLGLDGGVAGSLLKWLQLWLHATCWPTGHVDIIHISWAHGGPSQTWGGGTLYGPSLGFTSTRAGALGSSGKQTTLTPGCRDLNPGLSTH